VFLALVVASVIFFFLLLFIVVCICRACRRVSFSHVFGTCACFRSWCSFSVVVAFAVASVCVREFLLGLLLCWLCHINTQNTNTHTHITKQPQQPTISKIPYPATTTTRTNQVHDAAHITTQNTNAHADYH